MKHLTNTTFFQIIPFMRIKLLDNEYMTLKEMASIPKLKSLRGAFPETGEKTRRILIEEIYSDGTTRGGYGSLHKPLRQDS